MTLKPSTRQATMTYKHAVSSINTSGRDVANRDTQAQGAIIIARENAFISALS